MASGECNEQMADAAEMFQDSLKSPAHLSYNIDRVDLLSEEAERSWDAQARLDASDIELKASAIISKIREEERINLFGNMPGETLPGPGTRDMGGRFLTNMDRIKRSNVYRIAKKNCQKAAIYTYISMPNCRQSSLSSGQGTCKIPCSSGAQSPLTR